MQNYTLPNGEQTVAFTGELLNRKSSWTGLTDLRWTEIEMYRTKAGKYIVHKIGRSVVFHRTGQSCTSGEPVQDLLDMTKLACPRCKPDPSDDVVLETDRHTVHVSETAQGAVESCYTQDSDRVAYLTYPARQLLVFVSRLDDDIRDAYMVQRVD